MSYVYIALTIVLTVYGQLIIKWQVMNAGTFPDLPLQKIRFLALMFLNPWVVSALVAALLASVAWMAAMTRLQLSHAYPFMSATFVLVLVLSGIIFQEPITMPKMLGLGFIVIGIVVGSQG
jgi:multidrug transporter EmrE-like cation transporter